MTTISPTSAIANLLQSLGAGGNPASIPGIVAAQKPAFVPSLNGENPAGTPVRDVQTNLPQAFRILPDGAIEPAGTPIVGREAKSPRQLVSSELPPHLINIAHLPDGLAPAAQNPAAEAVAPIDPANTDTTPSITTPDTQNQTGQPQENHAGDPLLADGVSADSPAAAATDTSAAGITADAISAPVEQIAVTVAAPPAETNATPAFTVTQPEQADIAASGSAPKENSPSANTNTPAAAPKATPVSTPANAVPRNRSGPAQS